MLYATTSVTKQEPTFQLGLKALGHSCTKLLFELCAAGFLSFIFLQLLS